MGIVHHVKGHLNAWDKSHQLACLSTFSLESSIRLPWMMTHLPHNMQFLLLLHTLNFKLSLSSHLSNKVKKKEMSWVLYASTVGSLRFIMICTSSGSGQSIHGESLRRTLEGYEEDSEIYHRNIRCCIMLRRIRIYCQGLCGFRFCRKS